VKRPEEIRLAKLCEQVHPASSLLIGRRPEAVLSVVSALVASLLMVMATSTAPDLFVLAVRPLGMQPSSFQTTPSHSGASLRVPARLGAGESEPHLDIVWLAYQAFPNGVRSEFFQTFASQFSNSTGQALRRFSGSDGLAFEPRYSFQLEWVSLEAIWLPFVESFARRAEQRIVARQGNAYEGNNAEIDLHAHFELALGMHLGVFLPTDPDHRNVARIQAAWSVDAILWLALATAALALVVDLCIRSAVKQFSTPSRRTRILIALMTLVGALGALTTALIPSDWRRGSAGAFHFNGAVVNHHVHVGEPPVTYSLFGLRGCATAPYIGCGLWGCGALAPFVVGGFLWLLVLAPAVPLAALLALHSSRMAASVFRACHPRAWFHARTRPWLSSLQGRAPGHEKCVVRIASETSTTMFARGT
jgi:hypothetical protein